MQNAPSSRITKCSVAQSSNELHAIGQTAEFDDIDFVRQKIEKQ